MNYKNEQKINKDYNIKAFYRRCTMRWIKVVRMGLIGFLGLFLTLCLVSEIGYSTDVNITGIWKARLIYTIDGKEETTEAKLDLLQEDGKVKGSMELMHAPYDKMEMEMEKGWIIDDKVFLHMRHDDGSILRADLRVDNNEMDGDFYSMDDENNFLAGSLTVQKE